MTAEKVYSVFNKKTSKFELTFEKPFNGWHINADLGALGAADINNATITLQTYLPSSSGDNAIRFNLTTVAGTLGVVDRKSFQKIRLANDKTTRLEDFITLNGNVVNPEMIITPKPSHAGARADSLATFQSRITPIIRDTLDAPDNTSIVDLQYTDTFFVRLLDDYRTIILNQYADTSETILTLDSPILKIFAVTSIDNPDQLAIFTLAAEVNYIATVTQYLCDYIPSHNPSHGEFQCTKLSTPLSLDMSGFLPDFTIKNPNFEILSYKSSGNSFIVFLQRDLHSVRLFKAKNFAVKKEILISNEELSEISAFEIKTYDIIVDTDFDYVLMLSNRTKIYRINISEEFVWKGTRVADFIEAKAEIMIIQCSNGDFRARKVDCLIITDGAKFHQISIDNASNDKSNENDCGLLNYKVAVTYENSVGMYNPEMVDWYGDYFIILYKGRR